MARPSTLNRILVLLCLLAIPCAQLFGVTKVFLCDCSGAPVAMLEDRCFGADGEDCHPEGHKHDDGESQEGSEKHPASHAEFHTSALSLKPIALPAPIVADALHVEFPCFRVNAPIHATLLLQRFCDPPPDAAPARHSVLLI
jgi:hypothetical protein